MKWSIHIYDPKSQTTTTHVKDYPGTSDSMADAPAVVAKASRDFRKLQKYILAVPHRTQHATKKKPPSQLQREIDEVLASNPALGVTPDKLKYAQERANATRRPYAVSILGHVMVADSHNKRLMRDELGGIAHVVKPSRG